MNAPQNRISLESGAPEWVFEDGSTFALTGVAGGAAPGGIFSSVMCEYRDPDGKVSVWNYRRIDSVQLKHFPMKGKHE